MLSANSLLEYQHALSLSPLTPREPGQTEYRLPIALDLTPLPNKKRDAGPFRYASEELDTSTLAKWTPEMVAQWMHNAGVELQFCDRFVENDINGAILITLKFEDLRELGINSFGIRTKVWEQVHAMRNIKFTEPVPETDIEDAPDREARREQRKHDGDRLHSRRGQSKRRGRVDDLISPLESVSIVGIEQVMPKPHNCSKGENCRKWQRNKRIMDAFKKDHPYVDVDGGAIMIAGNPGNPETAEAMRPADDMYRPVSDAIPSVVASSDVMGPGNLPPLQYLAEATLRNVQSRDPQENVRQFLDFQHQNKTASNEVPPTPPFEMITQGQRAPHHGLQSLPKLSIPIQEAPAQMHPALASQLYGEIADSSEEATPTGFYRFGTPFSDMDVPLTAVPTGPIPRNASQSVPPDMIYRSNPAPPSRTQSRATARRPSFPLLPSLDENSIVTPIARQHSKSFSRMTVSQRPLQPPPRFQYPWTPTDRTTFEQAIAPLPASGGSTSAVELPTPSSLPFSREAEKMDPTITHQGMMKKRKTKMLRHEWNDYFFTLRGTRLAMHKDIKAANRTLEYIDIDDYAIACSSIASNKLSAAFKAMSLRRNSDKTDDISAFSFQLIPQDQKGGVRLRKRDSALPSDSSSSGSTAANGEGVNGTGKTHHFAVKSREDRIDWMRELMLAKALKQKAEGVEISVNGNMI
jgi:hypothetical protein